MQLEVIRFAATLDTQAGFNLYKMQLEEANP